MRFNHLHCHTEMSPDGLGSVENFVKFAKETGFDAIAMTDHGTLGNAVSFWAACSYQEIKPIFGDEIYLEWNGKRHHLTLNALNKVGFNNLIKINNLSHANWVSGYPLTTVDMLSANSEGIAFFSGCPASPMYEGSFSDGSNFIGTMYDIFGKDNSYIEFMFMRETTERAFEMQKRFGLKSLVTNDVHFTKRNFAKAHKVMTECRSGYSYESSNLFMKTPQEMYDSGIVYFEDGFVKKLMAETCEFANRVETWSMKSTPKLPHAGHLVPAMISEIWSGFEKDIEALGEDKRVERQERLQYELNTLDATGFFEYFAILYDIISFAKKNNIVIGPGRGSAAGCYALYLLGITGIDPIKYDLYFDRFLNASRKEYPDVDIDIESDRRGEVIAYAKKTWGALPIATYSTYNHKVLVHDLARHYKLDKAVADKAADAGPESNLFDDFLALHPDLDLVYNAMSGQIRHTGKHAGGIIITDQPVPIERNGEELVGAWVEGISAKQLTTVGIVKYDMLGLQSLSQLAMMRRLSGIDFEKLEPEDDLKPLELFRKGDVLGIFQWTGSDGIRDLTVNIQPTTFTDLAVINALYRPGALDAGTAQKYPDYKLKPRKFHPRIDKILEETYGIIVFQEQVMAIFAEIVGGTMADADLARRVIFKTKVGDPVWEKSVIDLTAKFFDSGKKEGFPQIMLEQIWSEIQTHSRYSFNRAHAAAYAKVAYWMAWFKYYKPDIFYSAMLSSDGENAQGYVLEMVKRDVQITFPKISNPLLKVEPDGTGGVRLPISIVKSVSENTAAKIIDEFNANGPFASLEDFEKRVPRRNCNSRVRKNLRLVGAFDGLLGDKKKFFGDDEDVDFNVAMQLEVLGFVIPPKSVVELIDESVRDNVACGFVTSWHDKTNAKGKRYRVYRLSPTGMFWSNDESKIEKIKDGDLLKVRKNNYGKEMEVKRIKV